MEKFTKSDEELKKELSPELYQVAREKGTEAPFSGELNFVKDKGVYTCAVCGNELFSSDDKFDSGTGWPSFFQPISKNAVIESEDSSHGMSRTEITCGNCGSHLGHVFNDAPKADAEGKPTTGLRYCMNSVCLMLNKQKENPSS